MARGTQPKPRRRAVSRGRNREMTPPLSPFVLIKSAGEMASAVARRLYMANIRRICMLDLESPLCVRREVSFCPALERGSAVVEGVEAVAATDRAGIENAWNQQKIAVVTTTHWQRIDGLKPDVVVDAIVAKRNLGTRSDEARLVIGLGPGFEAGKDCHLVIETNRGHNLGRVITRGSAQSNTGVPGDIGGYTDMRVFRAPIAGIFRSERKIGDRIRKGDTLGQIDGTPVQAQMDGILRSLLRPGTKVQEGLKLGDIDPRGERDYCYTISDKARAISGSVLESVMRYFNCADR